MRSRHHSSPHSSHTPPVHTLAPHTRTRTHTSREWEGGRQGERERERDRDNDRESERERERECDKEMQVALVGRQRDLHKFLSQTSDGGT